MILLCAFITKLNCIVKQFTSWVLCLWSGVHCCQLISSKPFWNFCITLCMIGEFAATSSMMFFFKSSVVPGSFSYSLLLEYPQRKNSQAMRSGDLAGHLTLSVSEVTRAGSISLRTVTAFPVVWAIVPSFLKQRVWISAWSLHCLFQKFANHLNAPCLIYSYCPACLVFKVIRTDQPKRDYTTPNNTFQNVGVLDEYQAGSQLSSSDSSENWHSHETEDLIHPSCERG